MDIQGRKGIQAIKQTVIQILPLVFICGNQNKQIPYSSYLTFGTFSPIMIRGSGGGKGALRLKRLGNPYLFFPRNFDSWNFILIFSTDFRIYWSYLGGGGVILKRRRHKISNLVFNQGVLQRGVVFSRGRGVFSINFTVSHLTFFELQLTFYICFKL